MAKKKAEPEEQTVTTEDLEQAVDEVNEQLQLDPGIKKTSDKYMRQELKEAVEDEDGELFEGDEEFTEGTYKVFEALGIEHDCVKVKDGDGDENGEEEEEAIAEEKKGQHGRMAKGTPKKETKKGEMKMKAKVSKKKNIKIKSISTKKETAKKKTGVKRQGIGQFVVKNLKNRKFKKLSNQEIVDKVKEEFPGANTTPQNINWYRGKIKKGEL